MKKIITTAAALLAAGPALAHHPLAGAQMETFTHGMMSGVGHPVLGFDHLFFVALVGIAAIYTGRRFAAPLAFIAAMLLGTLLSSFGIAMPATEPMIIVSLLALGGIVAAGRNMSFVSAMTLFAFAGLFHGSAFGGTIAEQEIAVGGSVLTGYLLGLGITQYLIAIAAGSVAVSVWKATEATAVSARMSGAFVAGMGVFLALEGLEGAAFSALGLS